MGVPELAYQRGFEAELDDMADAGRSKAKGTGDEHGTPDFVLEAIYKTFGAIDLDPCGHPDAIVEARCKFLLPKHWENRDGQDLVDRGFIYTDGEIEDWNDYGLSFCNGPFSTLHWWVKKSAEMEIYRDGKATGNESIILTPVRTTHSAWQNHIFPLHHVTIFAKSRWKFHGAPTTAPFHTALSYRGYRPARFTEGFKHLGAVCRNSKQGDLFYCPF